MAVTGDIFGNLREWGHIPQQLSELAQSGTLDDHQAGLVRLLRYEHNWRLRELALESMEHVQSPNDELLLEVLRIVMDESLYHEVRTLAARVLGGWVRNGGGSDPACCEMTRQIVEQLRTMIELRQTPVLYEAVGRVLAAVDDASVWDSVATAMPARTATAARQRSLHR